MDLTDNIEYIIMFLWALTLFVSAFMLFYYVSHKNDKRNKGIPVHLNSHKNNEVWNKEKSISAELTRKEKKKLDIFRPDSLQLLKYKINKNFYIYNGHLESENNILLDRRELFFKLQTFFKDMFLDKDFLISNESIFILQKTFWRLDLSFFKDKLNIINNQNNIIQEGIDLWDFMIRRGLLKVINHKTYCFYSEDMQMSQEKKQVSLKKAIDKEYGENERALSAKEKKILSDFKRDSEFQEEINSIIGKNKGVIVLDSNIETRELHVYIHYTRLFNKEIWKMIEFYKSKGNFKNIIFYI